MTPGILVMTAAARKNPTWDVDMRSYKAANKDSYGCVSFACRKQEHEYCPEDVSHLCSCICHKRKAN